MIDFRSGREPKSSSFDYISIRIASPEEIRGPRDTKERERLELQGQRYWWSWGEVTKPETINYRSFKPEKDGLFCERIFGPVKDWECHCGKYKRIRYRGVICDRCGVEVTLSKVRRERMGHIELSVPVAHIWFFKTLPSPMGNLLNVTLRDLERVIYYSSYIVIEPGDQDVEANQLLDEDEFLQLRHKAREEGDHAFKADIGAPAVRELLNRIDVKKLAEELRGSVATETSQHRKKQMLKRLKIVDAFLTSGENGDVPNHPAWMILDVIPVIPPDLRPLVPLDGGRFATSDLNDLYRRVINRNNRLQKLIQHKAPEVILRNEKRMLQEAVDALFDNGRRSKAIRGRGKRPLKSLSDMLKGKQGRFRQNLLGKRVDYSGRSVIVVGPELRLHQCGLPKAMAVELFKPFIIHKLVEKGIAETVKRAKKIVEKESPEVYEILEEIIQDHPVLLNRAPTLHRLGIQAFEPVLVEGKAIRIHPLVCAAFNADFDGDQMAVHVPLSFEAQLEARMLMISSNNILKPSDGRPVAEPSQDMVLGSYFLTKLPRGAEEPKDGKPAPAWDKAKHYGSLAEIELALLHRRISFHTAIHFWYQPPRDAAEPKPRWVRSTAGRVLFNSILPRQVVANHGFRNDLMRKKALSELVLQSYREAGLADTVVFLDRLKEFGFRYATQGGISIGVEDLEIPGEKVKLLEEADKRVQRFQRAYNTGQITFGERYNKVIDAWTHANNDVAEAMVNNMRQSRGGFNPVFMMFDSGSRGSRDQIRQLAGMRGLMAKPQKKLTGGIGEIIESPIKSNFREGLTGLEYFISTHGARKGLADTALKTADAGYLTRRLVDVAQDVTITEEDCGTIQGLEISALKEGEDVIEPLKERILGSVASEDVFDPHELDEDGDPRLLVQSGKLIDEELSIRIDEAGIEKVKIRSVLTCEARRGCCRMCYGRNLATMDMVDMGEAIGILAAQSIGEPGTQLTLRTFHIGGASSRIAEEAERRARASGLVKYTSGLEFADVSVEYEDGTTAMVRIALTRDDESADEESKEGILVVDPNDPKRVLNRYPVPEGALIQVKEGDTVQGKNSILYTWDPYNDPSIIKLDGELRWKDLVPGSTLREELDESTGLRSIVVMADPDRELHPSVLVYAPNRKDPQEYILAEGSRIILGSDADQITRAMDLPDEGNPWSTKFKVDEYPINVAWPSKSKKEAKDKTVYLSPAVKISRGVTVTKMPRQAYKTRDITGGLPRVAELFEARRPKDPATISEIDGIVKFGEIKRGKREIYVYPVVEPGRKGEPEPPQLYEVGAGKHLRVHEGDRVRAGDRLTEGPVNPHDILRIKGPRAVQEYLLNEVQEVYRLQGVRISDKHIGTIVRQMLQKVRVTDPGDTDFLEGETVDKLTFRDENERVIKKKGAPAQSEPVLLGITKASLTTQSFISAASFQETTRVLTDAAIRGAKDDLLGLKENIIIGHLIPAGSGIYRYAEIEIEPPAGYEPPPPSEAPVEAPAPVPVALLADDEE
ncbi:MAG: DNA-directed RNA polymerase subunit beta' [Gemmatimonadetes bacterium]|nr:DNA-directed RNA polymerase subunit beta' [Gemmatimonadota bacterium]MBK9068120.1 DNA-directed RNA polymerase subunit beta' [Gemmatimonadota bacterium]MBP6668607.1 DNA-directed RNA polymerase subunit beta' [Gemmatimonadales bacterium]